MIEEVFYLDVATSPMFMCDVSPYGMGGPAYGVGASVGCFTFRLTHDEY